MSITHNLVHGISEVNHLLRRANPYQASAFRPRDQVLRSGHAMLIGRPCLAIQSLREAMKLRGLETDTCPLEQNLSLRTSAYDVFVIFLTRCEPFALQIIEQRMAELRVQTQRIPAVALIEDAEDGSAAFAGMGFSTVILGLPSASFAVDVVHLLMRGSRQLRELDSADGDPQVPGERLEAEEASLVPADICFTRRETDLLELLRRGLPNKLIAYELGISESTVKAHLRSIMMKLKAKNRTQAVSILAREIERTNKESIHD